MITALVIDQTFQELIKQARVNRDGILNVPVRMMLDEVGNIAPINNLDRRVAVMRSRGARISLMFQGVQQFENTYGQGVAAEILDSCDNQLVMAANHESTSKPISSKLGNTTIMISSQSETENRGGGSSGKNYNFTGKPLMDPSEIEKMSEDNLILFQKGHYPAFLKKYLYDHIDRWKDLKKIHWVDEKTRTDEPVKIFSPLEEQENDDIDLFA